jgi:hypothetical protein
MRPFPLFALAVAVAVAACGSDTGTNTPPPPPVTSVQIIGDDRVKVGDGYQLSVESRTAEGTIVQRPVTWSVVEAGKGTVSGSGVFTPLQTGQITVRAAVEGITALGTTTAYDWVVAVDGGTIAIGLDADVLVSNKLGQSEYPLLLMGCTDGAFALGIALERFVTASGAVAYAFNNGSPITDTWLESDDFDILIHPGLTNLSQKNFASQLAASSRFTFTFTEFQSTAKTTVFRLNGLAQLIAPALAACPSNALREESQGGDVEQDAFERLRLTLEYQH